MPRLLLVGIALILLGLVGLAVTVGDPAASRTLVRYVFIPAYVAGTITLIVVGALWLWDYTKRR